jgi:hypothetical protein
MTVTVCIPAYRAGQFLAETLNSVVNQTYADLRVEIGVDPADGDGTGAPEDTLAALTPFLADRRFRARRNPTRLGWDGNIRALLERVETPYYAILPHDDIWDPRYVETFLGVLEQHAQASVAYGDLFTFGVADPWRHAVELPRTDDVREQVLSFMLQGAEAMPWRGITRSALLPSVGGFPTDGHRGFAVECEYALALILAGPAVYLPRTLYYKRVHPPAVASASRARVLESSPSELEQAWRDHVDRMRRLLERGLASLTNERSDGVTVDRLIWAAFTAAMLRRCPSGGRLAPEDADGVRALLTTLAAMNAAGAGPVMSRLHLVLCGHEAAIGDIEQSGAHAEAAVAANPASAGACFALAAHFESRGRLLEALDLVAQAERAFPGGAGLVALRRKIFNRLGWSAPLI